MSQRTGSSPPALEVPTDSINEAVVIAAALADAAARKMLLSRILPDQMHLPMHAAAWRLIGDLERRGLDCDLATIRAISNGTVDVEYLGTLLSHRPDVPKNLQFHVDAVLWNHARVESARGPLAMFLEAIKDPTRSPEEVRALARSVAVSFDGYEERKYLRDPGELLRESMQDLDERASGKAIYPYGLPFGEALDEYEAGYIEGEASHTRVRLRPAAAPGKITLVTGVTGSGKSTLVKLLVLGQVQQRRKVLFGAWEEEQRDALQDMAITSLNVTYARRGEAFRFSKRKVRSGQFGAQERVILEERKHLLLQWIRFLANPFMRRVREKSTNDRNLDLLHGYIADSGCEVFVADLFERALVSTQPEDEKFALFRTQSMAQETRVHVVLAAQQRGKDIEMRADKKPTREGVKGSGAWVEVSEHVLATYRPALYKQVDPRLYQICVLKQKEGPWPQIVEFDLDLDRGILSGGTTLPYDSPGDRPDDALAPKKAPVVNTGGGGRRRGS